MKNYLLAVLLFFSLAAFCQDGNFDTITFNNLIKSSQPSGIFGWGESFDRSVDVRSNPHPNYGTMMINHHTGITFSAHSVYGGLRFYNQGYPNTFDTNTGAKMVMSIMNGNVGIGKTDPVFPLDISGTVHIDNGNVNFKDVTIDNTDGITWHNPSPTSYGIHRTSGSWVAPDYQQLRLGWETGILLDPGMSYGKSYVEVKGNGLRVSSGNVAIGGTAAPEGYKLAVAGKMIAEEIKVKLQSSWPDYVFEESYHLPSLKETEKFIKTNKHLQGIPSAKEVAQDGLNLADMNAKLLQKLEELTLHIIELNKRIEKLEGL